MKHLNPRQGITTDVNNLDPAARFGLQCETPKSPPGDYNAVAKKAGSRDPLLRVKHLNPRQGITTGDGLEYNKWLASVCVKHLNPRQGITTLLG